MSPAEAPLTTQHEIELPRPLSGLHLLVAEDHAVNQILIRQMLQLAGAQVHLVSNGLEAIEALFAKESSEANVYDLVLMDCQMPELDGFTATTRIRRREKLSPGQRRIPIIAMTALAMPEDTQRCLDSGMDDYCSKPIDELMLMGKILAWTGRVETVTPDMTQRLSA
jgi:two-component system, sensor histidine kinase and response regulator